MRIARLVLALVGVASVARAELRPAPAATLDVATETLPNGLRVIVAPDPSVSSVVVHLRYAGGAAAEDADHRGYTHLVERLMSAGTVHTKPGEFDERIDAAGGFSTSVTTTDHASVFEQVPAGALELALWLEAERMAGLADGIRDDELAKARDAIAGEYRAAYEDQPYALADRAVRQRLWAGDPAANDPLGEPAIVATATRASVRAFVRERIVPANATLAIVGKVEPEAALALARRYFGWIPRGTALARAATPIAAARAALAQPAARPVEDHVVDPVAKIVVAYRIDAPGDAVLADLEIAARALAGSRSSRLVRALGNTRLASDVRAEVVRSERGAELRITATPLPTSDAARVAKQIRTEAAGLAGATDDEVRRASLAARHELVAAIENLAFRADALATWQVYAGEANHFDAELGRLRVAQTSHVRRTAGTWLVEGRAVTVIGRPKDAP